MAKTRKPVRKPKAKVTIRQETVTVVQGLPLRLCFEPDAIREHFGDSVKVEELGDHALQQIGADALVDDELYEAFDAVLRRAIQQQYGFDPDADEDEGDDD